MDHFLWRMNSLPLHKRPFVIGLLFTMLAKYLLVPHIYPKSNHMQLLEVPDHSFISHSSGLNHFLTCSYPFLFISPSSSVLSFKTKFKAHRNIFRCSHTLFGALLSSSSVRAAHNHADSSYEDLSWILATGILTTGLVVIL